MGGTRNGRLTARFEAMRLRPEFPCTAIDWSLDDAAITSLHSHEVCELGLCHAGSATYLLGGRVAPVHAGSIVLLPPGVAHYSRSRPGTRSRWTYVFLDAPRLFAGLAPPALVQPPPDLAQVLPPDSDPPLAALLRALIEALADRRPWRDELARGLALAVLARWRRGAEAGVPAARRHAIPARLAPALRLIEGDGPRPTVPDLAAACGCGERQLRRLVREAFGVGPLELVRQRRCQRARLLAQQPGHSVAAAAETVGYRDAGTFRRAHRHFFGCAPRAVGRMPGR
jgi:AraC-like DNA-binding protein